MIMIKSPRIRKALASLAAAGAELTVFQQFALAATFDQLDFEQWVAAVKTDEQSKPQQCIVNSHTDMPDHANTHNNTGTYSQGTGHWNQAIGHSQHCNVYGHINNGIRGGHWDATEYAQGYHVDEGAHEDKYNQVNTHNDDPNRHADAGFDHTNYVPSLPRFYDLAAGKQISGTVKIALYSYDKNADGAGSQDSYSKTVLYTVLIRKVKNLDGAPNLSAWRTLASSAVTTDGKLVLDLNTVDPLGTGNTNPKATEGIYEIQAVATNRLWNGVTHSSQTQTVTVVIKQNQSPTVRVDNGNEFINFTFSFDGVLSPTDAYKAYADGLYAGADATKQAGLLVRVTMRDPDSQATTQKQWQKGRIILKSPSGTTIATANIIWTDTGNEITSSENTDKAGLAFIPKDSFVTQDMKNAVVTVEVTDYTDAACTQPTGTVVQQTTVSATDLTPLYINVDVTKPTVTASTTDYSWKNANINVALTYTDLTSGIKVQEYKVTTTPDRPTSGWLPYTGAIPITTDGRYYIHWHAVDKVQNEQYGYFGPYSLDKTPPTATHQQVDVDATHVRLDVTASDNLSGVKRIKLPNGTYVNGNTASYTVPATETNYTFVIEDNAGNTYNYVAAVSLNPVVTGTVFQNIVNPPANCHVPVSLPVGTPVPIKAGYQMTYSVAVSAADTVQIRLLAGGQPVLMHTQYGSWYALDRLTGTRGATTLTIAFWVEPTTPKGTVLSMEITAIRNGSPPKTTVDAALGRNLMVVVGSSYEDAAVNQTR